MGRGSYTYHLLLQEGPYHVLHTLSPGGVLMHLQDLKPDRTQSALTWGEVGTACRSWATRGRRCGSAC